MGHVIHGPRTEPPGHVLDLHDIEAVAGALIANAKLDIEHEAKAGSTCRWDGVRIKGCERGGHICPGCRMLIWDCAREWLGKLADAMGVEGYRADTLHTLLDAADHAKAG